MRTDPESAKQTVKMSIFCVLMGSVRSKAVHRPLMNLTPGHFMVLQVEGVQGLEW